MDNTTHIFGKGTVKPDTVFKFVATTLELSNIRAAFVNKTMGLKTGAKRITDVENAMIGLAQDLGITVQQWKDATAKVLSAQKVMNSKKAPKLEAVDEEKIDKTETAEV